MISLMMNVLELVLMTFMNKGNDSSVETIMIVRILLPVVVIASCRFVRNPTSGVRTMLAAVV